MDSQLGTKNSEELKTDLFRINGPGPWR